MMKMRKTIVTLVALCAAMAANATVLRVSNVSGSTAPYSTFEAALTAAAEGDTIMLDASPTAYTFGKTVDKRVVILGPGYWLKSNGIIQEGGNTASFSSNTPAFWIGASGVVISGVWFTDRVVINNNCNDVVIKRCCLRGGIEIASKAQRCVLHQNHIRPDGSEAQRIKGSYHQITNNIFITHFQVGYTFYNMPHAYIAYNTFLGDNRIRLWDSGDCTVEKNISGGDFYDSGNGVSSYSDNIIIENTYNTYDNDIRDSALKALNWSDTHGAFAGDSPYVISGVPSAPVIEDLVVPTTVEYGSKMNVTIKVGVQK